MSYLSRLKLKFKFNSPVRLIFDGLRRFGFSVLPYYLMRETADDAESGAKTAAVQPITAVFRRLNKSELQALPDTELAYLSEEWITRRFDHGDFCLALLIDSQVAAICWASRTEAILVFEAIPLRTSEAYIYAAHTMSEFRGRGLMPLLRRELCCQLNAGGATDMYSLVDSLNRPANKVYEKMSASKVQSGVAFSLFGVLNSRISFRNYEPGFGDR
ncbi:MAG: GNAT family N-acetyltransferase [Pseudomonadales bacterium]